MGTLTPLPVGPFNLSQVPSLTGVCVEPRFSEEECWFPYAPRPNGAAVRAAREELESRKELEERREREGLFSPFPAAKLSELYENLAVRGLVSDPGNERILWGRVLRPHTSPGLLQLGVSPEPTFSNLQTVASLDTATRQRAELMALELGEVAGMKNPSMAWYGVFLSSKSRAFSHPDRFLRRLQHNPAGKTVLAWEGDSKAWGFRDSDSRQFLLRFEKFRPAAQALTREFLGMGFYPLLEHHEVVTLGIPVWFGPK